MKGCWRYLILMSFLSVCFVVAGCGVPSSEELAQIEETLLLETNTPKAEFQKAISPMAQAALDGLKSFLVTENADMFESIEDMEKAEVDIDRGFEIHTVDPEYFLETEDSFDESFLICEFQKFCPVLFQ